MSGLISACLALLGAYLIHVGLMDPRVGRDIVGKSTAFQAWVMEAFPRVYRVMSLAMAWIGAFFILLALANILGIIDLRNPCD
ncbi:MAG: hypothetical protein MI747_08710 [Desulfobacterales bacterium]|nr:hypothetical protein [Desulfobacterales bacterium]